MIKKIIFLFSLGMAFSLNFVNCAEIHTGQKQLPTTKLVKELASIFSLYFHNEQRKLKGETTVLTMQKADKAIQNNTIKEIKNLFSQWGTAYKIECLGFVGEIKKGANIKYKFITSMQYNPKPENNDVSKSLHIKIFREEKEIGEDKSHIVLFPYSTSFAQLEYKNMNFAKKKMMQGFLKFDLKSFDGEKFPFSPNNLGVLEELLNLIHTGTMGKQGQSFIMGLLKKNRMEYRGIFGEYEFILLHTTGDFRIFILINVKDKSKHIIICKKKNAKKALFIPNIDKCVTPI